MYVWDGTGQAVPCTWALHACERYTARHDLLALPTIPNYESVWWTQAQRGEVVARVVEQADKALGRTIPFPPEGGQHNQWYQCDRCQIGLETVDDTHHKCLKCGEIYLGYPYDNVIYSKKFHGLTRDMNRCAWAFALTGKLTYAQKARDILVEFAERYETYPLHSANQGKRDDPLRNSSGHIFEQTLNEASWS